MSGVLKEWLEKAVLKIDAMSLRERVMIFAAAAFVLVSFINALFLNPLQERQKKLSLQVVQQQEKMKEIQANMAALMQAQKDDVNSPLRDHIRSVQKQIDEHELYLKGRRDKLVPPEKMGELLEQVLNKNERLQLIALETLPATPLIEPPAAKPDAGAVASAPVAVPVKSPGLDHQVYKHGVKITVRGSYADLMQYLTALEKLPTQMYWGAAKMNVTRYPTVELTLTLYTLSLDAIWLRV